MFCPKCGIELDNSNNEFCGKCGNGIKDDFINNDKEVTASGFKDKIKNLYPKERKKVVIIILPLFLIIKKLKDKDNQLK